MATSHLVNIYLTFGQGSVFQFNYRLYSQPMQTASLSVVINNLTDTTRRLRITLANVQV